MFPEKKTISNQTLISKDKFEDLIKKIVTKLIETHKVDGTYTKQIIGKAIQKKYRTPENILKVETFLKKNGISVLSEEEVTESQTESGDISDLTKEESIKEGKSQTGKTDDPVRLYLRDMGSVELLSREGEIAIAKRIEAGKDVMLNALSQSPITAQQFFQWDIKLNNDEILVREIIDIDTNYMEDDNTGQISKQKKSSTEVNEKEKSDNLSDNIVETDDEFNPTLAAMETEIKPKVLKTVANLNKDYNKLVKYQREKLQCILNSTNFSSTKKKSYNQIVEEILKYNSIQSSYSPSSSVIFLSPISLGTIIKSYS